MNRTVILRLALPVLVAALLVGALVLRTSITHAIDDAVAEAWRAHPAAPDRVEALLAFVADADQTVSARNRAVWALGQLRDARALPVLEAYVKADCRHGEELCQHELAKAIALCRDPGPDLLRVAGG